MIAYYIHDLDPLIFRIYDNVGPRWYGLAYVLAFICSYFVYRVLARRGFADLSVAKVSDFITGAALFGVIVGGRIGYVLFYKPEMLREPLSILRVWEGGMSSHGGMLGLLAFTFYYAWRHKISWTNLGDNLVVTAPIGLFFGRCANFINGELYGRATDVSWAMQFPKELTENFSEAERAINACRQIDPSLVSSDAIVAAARHEPAVKESVALNFNTAASFAALRGVFRRDRFVRDPLARAHANASSRMVFSPVCSSSSTRSFESSSKTSGNRTPL